MDNELLKEAFFSQLKIPLTKPLEDSVTEFYFKNTMTNQSYIDLLKETNDKIYFEEFKGLSLSEFIYNINKDKTEISSDYKRYLLSSLIYDNDTKLLGLNGRKTLPLGNSDSAILEYYSESNKLEESKFNLNSENLKLLSDCISLQEEKEYLNKILKQQRNVTNEDEQRYYLIKKDAFKNGYIQLEETLGKISEIRKEYKTKNYILIKDNFILDIPIMRKIKKEYISFLISENKKENCMQLSLKSYFTRIKIRSLNDLGRMFSEEIKFILSNIDIPSRKAQRSKIYSDNTMEEYHDIYHKLIFINKSEKNTFLLNDNDYNYLKKEINEFLKTANIIKIKETSTIKRIQNEKIKDIDFIKKLLKKDLECEIKKESLANITPESLNDETIWKDLNSLLKVLNISQKEKVKKELNNNIINYLDEIKKYVEVSTYLEITEENQDYVNEKINECFRDDELSLIEMYYSDNYIPIIKVRNTINPSYFLDGVIGNYSYFSLFTFLKDIKEKLDISPREEIYLKLLLNLSVYKPTFIIMDEYGYYVTPDYNFPAILYIGKNKSKLKINPFETKEK